ncbi:MAG TPA: 23S rRNA (uracil(1939)-C(5))-methyltransferase RlmD [Candidatus Polarisedimenticolia bacterium]|nr:23S rRNA (uracil(1939)-C(5))-methyltransferase RlmD [Candidatus Polarisedimenticolia bacterium]
MTLIPGATLSLDIVDLARGGRGVGRHEGFVVFVPGALPGETVRARIRKVHRAWADAALLEIVASSRDRRKAPCPHFDRCGGCDLQHLAEAGQAEAKRLQVVEALRRIGTLGEVAVDPVRRPGPPLGYRFRMDFDWRRQGGRDVLGLHRRGAAEEVIAVDPCLLAGPVTTGIAAWIGPAAARAGLSALDAARDRGLLRRLTVQEARGTREVLVTFDTGRGDPPALPALAQELVRRFPRVVGVVRREHARDGHFLSASILAGRDTLEEELDGDRFRIPAGAFFQPNPEGSLEMRRAAVEALAPSPGDRVLELFSGVGFLSVAAARCGARVTTVESDREATAAARENLRRAGAGETEILHGDVTRLLADLMRREWDAVLLDPPRTGLAPEAARLLAGLAARRVVYVSCDPGTLARDLGILVRQGSWRIASVVPFDLFPQTQHIEVVAALKRGA